MEVLENLRFKNVSRYLTKNYEAGIIRNIKNRAHNGFIFCIEGEMRFTMGDKSYICDKKHVILAPKKSDYDLYVDDCAECIILDFEIYEGIFNEMYSFPIVDSEGFYHEFLKMQKRTIITISSELVNLSKLYEITACINGYGCDIKKYAAIKESEIYLEDNLYNYDLTISDIADASNISEVYFRRLFKEKHGISPLQYISDMRIKKAKTLLIGNDEMSISDISIECGYLDVYSFSRTFKNSVGISPSQYKKNMLFRNC